MVLVSRFALSLLVERSKGRGRRDRLKVLFQKTNGPLSLSLSPSLPRLDLLFSHEEKKILWLERRAVEPAPRAREREQGKGKRVRERVS